MTSAEEPGSGVTVIDAFLRTLAGVLELASDHTGQRSGHAAVKELMASARQGRTPREGQVGSSLTYLVHGAGVRFSLSDGSEIDIDVDLTEDLIIWDAWRVRQFAISRGVDVTEADAVAALRSHAGVEECRQGWFTSRSASVASAEG